MTGFLDPFQFLLNAFSGWMNGRQSQLAEENRSWEYHRIEGALSNLSHEVSRGMIADILARHGIEPAPERQRKTTWKEFPDTTLGSDRDQVCRNVRESRCRRADRSSGPTASASLLLRPVAEWIMRYSETARWAGLPAELASDNSEISSAWKGPLMLRRLTAFRRFYGHRVQP